MRRAAVDRPSASRSRRLRSNAMADLVCDFEVAGQRWHGRSGCQLGVGGYRQSARSDHSAWRHKAATRCQVLRLIGSGQRRVGWVDLQGPHASTPRWTVDTSLRCSRPIDSPCSIRYNLRVPKRGALDRFA